MRQALEVSAVVFILGLTLAAQTKRVPSAEVKKFRLAFAEALADPEKASKLLDEAARMKSKYAASSLRDMLASGPLFKSDEIKERKGETFERFERVLSGLKFDFEGGAIEYDVDLPERFDNTTPRPLLIDPGHGSGAKQDQEGKAGFLPFFRNQAKQAGGDDWLVVRTEIVEQIGAGGLRGGLPEEEVLPAFDALLRDISSRFAVDPDRIYVTGLSQTGFWTWYLGRATPQRFAAILPISAVTWQVDRFLDNFATLPAYVLHGDADNVCPVEQPRKTTAAMKEKSFPVVYEEVPGAHDGRVFGQIGRLLKDAAEKKRQAFPKKISHAFAGPHSRRAYWLQVVDFENTGTGKAGAPPIARIDIEVDGQAIRITKAEGVKKLEIGLAPELIDIQKAITIHHGDKLLFKGKVKPDFETSLRYAIAHADWTGVPEAFVEVKL